MPQSVVVPDETLEAARRGVLHELIAYVDDLKGALEALHNDLTPAPDSAVDALHFLKSFRGMVDLQDRVGWPGQ